MVESNYVLQCKDIVKTFSGVTVLDHAQLNIKRGEIHALMGENGAGKSTIIKIITGVYPMDSGEIFYNGKPVTFGAGRMPRNWALAQSFRN